MMKLNEKLAKINIEFSQILEEYIEKERNNKGCEMMCLAIDKFVNKEFKIGLNLIDDDYVEENNIFNKKLEILQERLENLSDKLKNEVEKDILDLSEYEVNKILNTYFAYLFYSFSVSLLLEYGLHVFSIFCCSNFSIIVSIFSSRKNIVAFLYSHSQYTFKLSLHACKSH